MGPFRKPGWMEAAYVLRSSFFNNNELIRDETLKVSSEAQLAFLGVRTFEAALHINFSHRKTHPNGRAGRPIPSCLASTEHPTRIDRRPLFSLSAEESRFLLPNGCSCKGVKMVTA